jgi:hypothetical protein
MHIKPGDIMEKRQITALIKSQFPDWLRRWECRHEELFGGSIYFVNRNLFIMLKEGEVTMRLPELVANKFLSEHLLAHRLTSADGRVCKEFVVLPYSTAPDEQQMSNLRQWIERSAQFVSTLPERSKACSVMTSP